jgi:CHAT domain-containing protein
MTLQRSNLITRLAVRIVLHTPCASDGAVGGGFPAREAADFLLSILQRFSGKEFTCAEGQIEGEFDNAGQAVECACEMQRFLTRFGQGLPADASFNMQCGIDTGSHDRVAQEATRKAALASPGQIIISPATLGQLDPYLTGLCEEASGGGSNVALEGLFSVCWSVPAQTRTRSDKADTIFLDVLLQDSIIKISFNEGEEINGTLTHYEEMKIDLEQLRQTMEAVQQNFQLANNLGGGSSQTLDELRRRGSDLYDLLFNSGLKRRLADTTAQYLMLNMNEEALPIPWEILYDGQQFMGRRFAMGRHVRTSEKALGKSRPAPLCASMLVVSNPSEDLYSSSQEGVAISSEFAGSSRVKVHLINGALRRGDAIAQLRECDIFHYSGHARFEADQPGQSGWILSDGRLTINDIKERLAGGDALFPSLVFCNACQSGQAAEGRGENVSSGMAGAFLLAGVRHYIGTFWEVLDAPSGDLAVIFYRRLAAGHSIGKALQAARERLATDRGETNLIWASYVLYGDPRRIFFGSPEYAADRMLYAPSEESSALEGAFTGAQMTRSQSSPQNGSPQTRWMAAASIIALVVALGAFGIWWTTVNRPPTTPVSADNSAGSELDRGLALYRQGLYDEALGFFRSAGGKGADSDLIEGLIQAAHSRSQQAMDKQRRDRIDAALQDLNSYLEKGDPPSANRDDWTSPVLTAALMSIDSGGEKGSRPGEDVAIAQWLEMEMLNSARLQALERRDLDLILREMRMQSLADPQERARTARLRMVQLWISASINRFDGKATLILKGTLEETSERVFIVHQPLGANLKADVSAAWQQVEKHIKQQLPIRGRLTAIAGAGWRADLGSEHGVTPSTLFQTSVGSTIVTLKVERVEARECILALRDSSSPQPNHTQKIQQAN